MGEIVDSLTDCYGQRKPFVLATVVATRGSVSARLGAKAIIDSDGTVIAGWIGGGCAQSAVCQTAIKALQDGLPRIVDLDLNDEVLGTGMPCGGDMSVFIDPIQPPPRLWILGNGLIAESLCDLGSGLGFQVFVYTDEIGRNGFARAADVIVDDTTYKTLSPSAGDCAVIATQHKGDHLSMRRLLNSELSYLGLIASLKRTRLILDYLKDKGFSESDLRRVHAPAGLDLGGREPEEIALSILSEIIMFRRGGYGRPKAVEISSSGKKIQDGARRMG